MTPTQIIAQVHAAGTGGTLSPAAAEVRRRTAALRLAAADAAGDAVRAARRPAGMRSLSGSFGVKVWEDRRASTAAQAAAAAAELAAAELAAAEIVAAGGVV